MLREAIYVLLLISLAILIVYLYKKSKTDLLKSYVKGTKNEFSLLTSILLFGSIFTFGNFIFFGHNLIFPDIGSDTVQQYTPYYISVIDSIRSGDLSLWDSSYGLGTGRIHQQTWFLDPFNIILIPSALLFGNEAIANTLLLISIFKIFLCAFFFRYYLTFFCKIPAVRVFCSALYGFNGFLLLWGQHYWFGNACILCILVLIAVERIQRSLTPFSFSFLALSIAFSIIISIYIACMVMMFAAVYTIIRCLYITKGIKEFLAKLFPIAGSVLIGILISCFIFLPASEHLLMSSDRIIGESKTVDNQPSSSILALNAAEEILFNFGRLFGNNTFATGLEVTPYSNLYEIMQFGCSICVLIFAFQGLYGLFASQISTKNKLLIIISSILVILFFISPGLGIIFNIGAKESYRSSFCFIPIILLIMAIGAERIILPRKASLTILVLSYTLTMGILVFSFLNATQHAKYISTIDIIAVTLIALLLYLYQIKTSNKTFILAVFAIAICTQFVDSFASTSFRLTLEDEQFAGYENKLNTTSTDEAIALLKEKDNSLYRIEKTYNDWTWFVDSMVQDYDSVSSYNTGLAAGLVKFYSSVWPNSLNPNVYYEAARLDIDHPKILSFLGVKYVLSKEKLDYDWTDLYFKYDDIYVYRNKQFEGFGGVYHNAIISADTNNMKPQEIENLLNDTAIVENNENMDLDPISNSNYNIQRVNESLYNGEVKTDGTALTIIPIPWDRGWSVSVDGNSVDPLILDYGFIGFKVGTGEHKFKLEYNPPFLYEGITLSVLGVILLVSISLLIWKKNKLYK